MMLPCFSPAYFFFLCTINNVMLDLFLGNTCPITWARPGLILKHPYITIFSACLVDVFLQVWKESTLTGLWRYHADKVVAKHQIYRAVILLFKCPENIIPLCPGKLLIFIITYRFIICTCMTVPHSKIEPPTKMSMCCWLKKYYLGRAKQLKMLNQKWKASRTMGGIDMWYWLKITRLCRTSLWQVRILNGYFVNINIFLYKTLHLRHAQALFINHPQKYVEPIQE